MSTGKEKKSLLDVVLDELDVAITHSFCMRPDNVESRRAKGEIPLFACLLSQARLTLQEQILVVGRMKAAADRIPELMIGDHGQDVAHYQTIIRRHIAVIRSSGSSSGKETQQQ